MLDVLCAHMCWRPSRTSHLIPSLPHMYIYKFVIGFVICHKPFHELIYIHICAGDSHELAT